MNNVNNMNDDEIKMLLESSITFKHKTLKEYIKESGRPLKVSGEIDYGQPVGNEIW